ncbi:insulin-like peptide receptor isoform X2 [Diadema antillarum]|uniref:insulin-like peptide receptor isoform X2 n=1 Tax=Diadema antillarum TaxID=105358 RepID=UPI003A85E365
MDIRNNVANFRKLENCTVIEGNLQILLIDHAQPSEYEGLSFPKLREITDYLMMFRVKNLPTLRYIFPNLAVIRGDSLFYNYALIIFEMFEMQEIGLPSLTAVMRGWVRIEKNINLCYMSTVDWSLIQVQGMENNFIKENKAQDDCLNFCPEEDGKRICRQATPSGDVAELCWTAQHCQKVCPVSCPRSCLSSKQCCHEQCIGGCSGPLDSNCIACRHFLYEGRCLARCPIGTYEFKNRRCVTSEQCPQGWKLFKQRCMQECPGGYMPDRNNTRHCLPCNGTCPKVCRSKTIQSVEDAAGMKGCTIVNGTLTISIHGGGNVVTELENNLGLIEVVTGALVIRRANSLVSLNFLKKLRRIEGQEDGLEMKKYSLYVLANNNLQQLFDWSLHRNITIANGTFFFHYNPKLCYSEIQGLHRIAGLKEPLSNTDVSLSSNGDQVACNTQRLTVIFPASFGKLLMVEWSQPNNSAQDTRDIVGYIVSYREAPFRNVTELDGEDACGTSAWDAQYVNPDHTATLINNLKPWTQYAFMVRTYTIAGAQFSARSNIVYHLTNEAVASPPSSLKVTSNSSSELVVTWKPPVNPNGNLTHYRIRWQPQYLPTEEFANRDFCREKLPTLKKSESTTDPVDVPEEEEPSNTGVGDGCCACPPDPEDLKREQEEARFQKAFENKLHNSIYVRRDYNNLFGGPDSKRRRRRDVPSEQDLTPESTLAPPLLPLVSPTRPPGAPSGNDSSSPSGQFTPSRPPPQANATTTTSAPLVKQRNLSVVESFHLEGLEHFTEYLIEVEACNLEGCSQAAAKYGRTMPKDSADEISSTVTVNHTADNRVRLTWAAPHNPNGIIVIHEVMIERRGGGVVGQDERNVYTIDGGTTAETTTQAQENIECVSAEVYRRDLGAEVSGLAVGNYTARVRAVSLAGFGPWTRPVVFQVAEIEKIGPTSPPTSVLSPMMGVTIAVSIAAVIIIFVFIIIFIRWQYRKDQMPDGVLYASVNPEYMSTSDMYVADEWEFPRDKLEVIRELGKGSFGMVYEGLAKGILPEEDISRVAIKSVQANASMRDRIEFLNEASVMKLIDTHHVVRLLGVVSKGQPTYVIMEFMAQGDLKNWLRARRPENQQDLPLIDRKSVPTLKELVNMAAEIADGMAYLSARKYVHRDLSARNCLVSEVGTCKVADFGLARDIYQSDYYRKERGGMLPIRWMAPESVKDGVFQMSSDVWSYGILLWEMATLGELPYQGLSNEEAGEYIKGGNVLRPPENCPEKLHEIMMACWQYQEKLRPTFGEILMVLDDTGLLLDTFPQYSFYLNEQLRAGDAQEGLSSKELEKVSILEQRQPQENLYTNMGPNASGTPPTTGAQGSPSTRNGNAMGNGSVLHGKSQIGKCTEC